MRHDRPAFLFILTNVQFSTTGTASVPTQGIDKLTPDDWYIIR